MNALADGHDSLRFGVILYPQFVHEDTRGIDDGTGFDFEFVANLSVTGLDAADAPVRFEQTGAGHVVEDHGPEPESGLGQRHREAGIVKLPVVIDNSAGEMFLLNGWDALQRLLLVEHP